MRKLNFVLLFLFYSLHVCAQDSGSLKGKIIKYDSQIPVQGASVKLSYKSKEKYFHSDSSGYFEVLNISYPVSINVSHIGLRDTTFTLKEPPGNTLVIQLYFGNSELSEVVVSTGFQKISKERASGSFDYIDNGLFNRQISTDVLSRLDGIASSVMFDNRALSGTPQISIRGLSTIFSDTKPLIILNNFPYEGDINNINPNDVENITVLKDASAASIWGVRAGNGVIVITTKKAAKNQPPAISFNTNMTFIQSPDMMQLPNMSSADYIDVEKMLFNNNFYDAIEQLGHIPLTPAVELMYKHKRGIITENQLQDELSKLATYDIRNDLNKYVYRNGLNQQYSLNVSGQNENMNYYISGGYDNNVGTINRNFKRYNLRSDNTIKLSKKLSLGASLYYTNTQTDGGRPTNFNSLYPYAQFADENGNALSIERYFRSVYTNAAETKGLLNWEYKPLEEINNVNDRLKTNSILINSGLNYNISKGFNASIKYQFENTQTSGRVLRDMNTYYTRNLINTYTQVALNGSITRPIPLGDILNESQRTINSQSLRAQLNYTKSWNKHQITGLAGAEARQAIIKSSQSVHYGYNPDILTSAFINYDTDYVLYSPNGGRAKIPYLYSPSELNDRFVSLFTNWAYTYLNRYNLTFSTRQDGSNLFGVKSNQRFTPLWSLGSSWLITNEKFVNITWLNLLKLRVTFGYSGNLNSNVSALPTMRYYNDGGNLTNTPYAIMVNPPNESLRWEKNGQLNIGLDFNLLRNRLKASLEFYEKNNTDLIGYMPIDQTTGAINPISSRGFSYLGNSASLKGRGFDVQLSSINIRKTIEWRTDLLYSHINTKVTEYLTPTNVLSNYLTGGAMISPIIGKPVYSIFALKWAGLDPNTGDPMGYLKNEASKDYAAIRNETRAEDLIYYGSATPTHFGAIRNTFTCKGLSISFNISYKFGFYFKRNSVFYGALYNGTGTHSDYNLRWQKPGDELFTQVPSMVYPNNANRDGYFYPNAEILISKGDNIRLQDINLSYQLNSLSQKLHIKKLELMMYATNLGIIWKADKHNVDPEFGNLSPLRTISFGIRASL
ncbi:SusC/RagA family TonB-linked outer membrane protein [Polluticaenibacter yanchengensis]|uniref:SusC/RagA family TonB-linked outer membrane protein n=1 Tax=Polluticaenibacter yanchengensis TaxID=3014562 RepID=A0ABT4UMF3_9BACT|nr:SusC/RagA family TonB-linked outer membrane protein [Chitinophagaceae bacterium LY-5]